MQQPSLFERLGGSEAIAAVVDDFVARCAGDTRINGKFARTDIPRLKKMLVDQVTAATGGPANYAGRDMKRTHDGMGVTGGFSHVRRHCAVSRVKSSTGLAPTLISKIANRLNRHCATHRPSWRTWRG